MKKHSVLITGIGTVCVIAIATLYAFLAALGKASGSVPIFLFWLAILTTSNAAFMYSFWRQRHKFTIGKQILVILWGTVVAWYWSFAPIYNLFTVNINNLQSAVNMFAYIWEVPVVGGVMFAFTGYLWFRPFQKYLEKKERPSDPEKFYRQALQYPIKVWIWACLLSIVAYFLGAVQQGVLAGMPIIEQYKNSINGVAIAIFVATIVYLLLDIFFISRVREQLEKDYPRLNPIRRRLTSKTVGVGMSLAVGTAILLILLAFNSFQGVVRSSVTARMTEILPKISEQFKSASTEEERRTAIESFTYGGKGKVVVLKEDSLDSFEDVAPETRQFIRTNREGFASDFHKEIKLVSFFKDGQSRKVVVSLIELSEFYIPFLKSVSTSFWGAWFIVILTLIVSIFMNTMLTRSIRLFSSKVASIQPETKEPHIQIYTGDEIEGLSKTLANYLEQVQNMDRAKNDFILLASHQLRTPPTMIKGITEILLGEGAEKLSETQKNYIEQISRNNQRVADLINTLLSVSSMELGIFTIEVKPTNPVEVVKTIIDELKPAFEEKHIVLTESYETVDIIPADSQFLRIVLHNLISNSLHYTEDGGKIEIMLSIQKKGETLAEHTFAEDSLMYAVKDTGYGIAEKDKEKLFTKFFRAETAKTHYTRGTGLGLYMAKAIMDQVGGSLWFKSQEGKGSTFYVSLPLTGMKQQALAHTASVKES